MSQHSKLHKVRILFFCYLVCSIQSNTKCYHLFSLKCKFNSNWHCIISDWSSEDGITGIQQVTTMLLVRNLAESFRVNLCFCLSYMWWTDLTWVTNTRCNVYIWHPWRIISLQIRDTESWITVEARKLWHHNDKHLKVVDGHDQIRTLFRSLLAHHGERERERGWLWQPDK